MKTPAVPATTPVVAVVLIVRTESAHGRILRPVE